MEVCRGGLGEEAGEDAGEEAVVNGAAERAAGFWFHREDGWMDLTESETSGTGEITGVSCRCLKQTSSQDWPESLWVSGVRGISGLPDGVVAGWVRV